MLHSVNFCPSAILTKRDSYAMLAKVTTLRSIYKDFKSTFNQIIIHTDSMQIPLRYKTLFYI